jgi:hypothetical protein
MVKMILLSSLSRRRWKYKVLIRFDAMFYFNLSLENSEVERRCRRKCQWMGELWLRSSLLKVRGSGGGGIGRSSTAATPPQNAAPAPNKNAGMLSPPKTSSKGPAPRETMSCGREIDKFNAPMDTPWPPPTSSVKVTRIENDTENVTARETPRSDNTTSATNVTKGSGPSSSAVVVAVRFAIAVISVVAA